MQVLVYCYAGTDDEADVDEADVDEDTIKEKLFCVWNSWNVDTRHPF